MLGIYSRSPLSEESQHLLDCDPKGMMAMYINKMVPSGRLITGYALTKLGRNIQKRLIDENIFSVLVFSETSVRATRAQKNSNV